MTAPTPGQAPTGGIEIPTDWEVVPPDDEMDSSVELIVREPASQDHAFRANLVVTMSAEIGVGFSDWQNAADDLFADTLMDYLPVDLERLYMDGHEAGHRLAHYRSADGLCLVLEQWFALIDGDGHTLTFTIDTGRYDAWADEFAAIAETWAPIFPEAVDDDDRRP